MIRINLAKQLQAASPVVVVSEGGAASSEKASKSLLGSSANLEQLKRLFETVLIFKKLILAGVVGYLSMDAVEYYKQMEINKVQAQLDKLNEEGRKLQADLNKLKKFEQLKKEMEADAQVIRVKLDVLKKLIADRSFAPKMLMSLSKIVPSDLWLTEFKLTQQEALFRGSAIEYNQVSDFMRALEGEAYFTNVTLKGSQQSKDNASGRTIASFEVVAGRKQ